jgi:hypothetical protein
MSYIAKATITWLAASLTLAVAGCQHVPRAIQLYQPPPPQTPLGTITDSIWQTQERSAEASDFVIYQHEFELNTANFNTAGKDHVTQIAYRLQQGRPFPVVVEQSRTSVKEGTEFEYPVHVNPKLDMERRERVAKALELMGVADAEQLVVVAPAYAPGMLATEAVGAYQQGFSGIGGSPGQPGFGFGSGGFGGFRGGFGFGGFGGFGF